MSYNNKIIGVASGIFDVFHIGHVLFLEACKQLCDKLIVVIASDDLTFQIKQKMPIFNEYQRKKMLDSIQYVDETIIRYNQLDIVDICKNNDCNIIFKGCDYKDTEWEPNIKNALNQAGISIQLIEHAHSDIHSSNLKQAIAKDDCLFSTI